MKKAYLVVLLFTLLFTGCVNSEAEDSSKGKIRVKTDRDGAYIYVNGKKKAMVGKGFTSILLSEGEYLIEVKKDSEDGEWVYKGEKKIFVGADTSTKLEIETKKVESEKQKERLKKEKIEREKKFEKWNKAIYKGKRSYSKNSENTVKDNYTGLIWMKENDGVERDWESAKSYCSNLTLDGYSDWRLPEIEELYYLADRSKFNPAINTKFFNLKGSWCWSSTEYKNNNSDAWYINFGYGYDRYYNKTNSNFLLCVRGE